MDNVTKIDQWIESNSDCKISKQITVSLQGKRRDLETFRIPLKFTFYNIKNGRFAAEYADLVKKENRQLDPKNSKDSQRIQRLLMNLDPNQSRILQTDLQENGQKEPGIITYDGLVVNGNRRRAVLEELASTGNSQFQFIEVARLPPQVSGKDLWALEAEIQLSRSVQLDYGPINELLKFREGIDVGLNATEIAKSLYGGFKEADILNKLERLQLIIEYLNFIGEPGVFNRAKGVHEHFIDLKKIIDDFEKKNIPIAEVVDIKNIAFQLIHDGISERDLRKIKDVVANDKSKKEFLEAKEHSKREEIGEKKKRKIDAERNDEFTPARVIFNNCLDSIKALSEATQPAKLLRRALTNLSSIDKENSDLTQPEIIDLMDNIETTLNHLRSPI